MIFNEFEFHAIISFLKLTIANNIILFYIFVHITHFLQFLNVNVFQSFKQQHAENVNKTVKLKNNKFDKLKFLTTFNLFCNKTFKIFTIKHVFHKIDIWFYNSNVVLNQLRMNDEKFHQIQNKNKNKNDFVKISSSFIQQFK